MVYPAGIQGWEIPELNGPLNGKNIDFFILFQTFAGELPDIRCQQKLPMFNQDAQVAMYLNGRPGEQAQQVAYP